MLGPWERPRLVVRKMGWSRAHCHEPILWLCLNVSSLDFLLKHGYQMAEFPSCSNIPYLINDRSTHPEAAQQALFVVVVLQTNPPVQFSTCLCFCPFIQLVSIRRCPHSSSQKLLVFMCDDNLFCAPNLCAYNLVLLCL